MCVSPQDLVVRAALPVSPCPQKLDQRLNYDAGQVEGVVLGIPLRCLLERAVDAHEQAIFQSSTDSIVSMSAFRFFSRSAIASNTFSEKPAMQYSLSWGNWSDPYPWRSNE